MTQRRKARRFWARKSLYDHTVSMECNSIRFQLLQSLYLEVFEDYEKLPELEVIIDIIVKAGEL